jgi:hypothetical protein
VLRRRLSVLLAMAVMLAVILASAAPAFADPVGIRGHCTDNPDDSRTCATRGGTITWIQVPTDEGIEIIILSRSGGSGGPGGGAGGHCTTNADTGELECVGGSGGTF